VFQVTSEWLHLPYHCFGIDPKREMLDSGGRPLPLSRGEAIRELF